MIGGCVYWHIVATLWGMGGNTLATTTRGAGGTHTEEEEAATRKKEKNQERELEMFVSILCVCVHIEYSICSSKTAITIQKSYGSLKPVAQGTSAAGNGFSLSRPTPTTSQGMLFSSVPSLDENRSVLYNNLDQYTEISDSIIDVKRWPLQGSYNVISACWEVSNSEQGRRRVTRTKWTF